jgi:hypothetical protein
MGQKGAEAHKEIAEEAGKNVVTHHEWHAIVKGLKAEFPELAHIAHFALNPITLAVAAIGGAFALWKNRVEELVRVMAGVELPDISSDSIGHVNAAAEAWAKYGEAVHKVSELLQGAQAKFDQFKVRMEQELALNLALIKSIHDYAAAKLEAEKTSQAEYEKRKARLDADAQKATDDTKEGAARDTFAAKVSEVLDLRAAAEDKRGKAGGIRVASKEDDAQTLEKMTKMSEAAKKDLEERQQRLGNLLAYTGGSATAGESIAAQWQQAKSGFSFPELIALEREGAEKDRTVIDRQRAFRAGMPGRERQRTRREALLGGAAADEAQAATIEAGLPNEELGFRAQEGANRSGRVLQQLTEAYKQLAEDKKQVAALSEEINKALAEGKGVQVSVLNKLKEFLEAAKELQKRIDSLDSPSRRTNHL